MPIIQPDTSGMMEQGAIEPGTYPAKIIDVEFQNSKSSGNPMIVPKIEITVEGKPRTRKAYLVITGEGAFNFDQLLRATGFGDTADQLKDPSVQPKPEFDTDELIGQEMQVIVEADTYNGQLRDKIRGYLPL